MFLSSIIKRYVDLSRIKIIKSRFDFFFAITTENTCAQIYEKHIIK